VKEKNAGACAKKREPEKPAGTRLRGQGDEENLFEVRLPLLAISSKSARRLSKVRKERDRLIHEKFTDG